jgi:PAS domain S-box-containing protein
MRIAGYPAADFTEGRSIGRQISSSKEDDLVAKKTIIGGPHAEKRPYEIDYRIRHADGGIRWVHDTGQCTFDPNGRPAYLNGLIIDITDRRHMEDALRESEMRFRQLFKESKAVQMIIDPRDGRIVDANAAAAAFYGWPLETLCTMRITDINTLSPQEVFREMEAARLEGRSVSASVTSPPAARCGTSKSFPGRSASAASSC